MKNLNQFKICFETIIVAYLLFVFFISGYIEHFFIWNILTIILLIVYCLYQKKLCLRNKNIILIVFCILSLLVLINILSTSSFNKTLFDNFRSLAYSLSVLLLFLTVSSSKDNYFFKILIKYKVSLNVILIINLIIAFIQNRRIPIFIKQSWIIENPYYPDLCCGLFGYNSTNILIFFSVLVILLNIYLIRKNESKKNLRFILLIYSVILTLFSMLIFSKNDGNAFFVLLPFFILMSFKIDILKKIRKHHIYLFSFGILVTTVVLLFVIFNKDVNTFINNVLIQRLIRLFTERSNFDAVGSTARITIVNYALQNEWGWFVGKGLGFTKFHSQEALGFSNFGISSSGALINLAGIWIYLCYCVLYSLILSSFIKEGRFKYRIYITSFIVVIMLSFYTYLFTEIRTNIVVSLIMIVLDNMLYLKREDGIRTYEEENR